MRSDLGIKRLEVGGEGISIDWTDGHQSHYEARYLRISCSCAECVEEWSQRKLLDAVSVPADIRVVDHLMVGRYAVQFLWSDAHFTGIYPFDMLRSLCRCEECTSAQGQQRSGTGSSEGGGS